jgi:hypothetical protein
VGEYHKLRFIEPPFIDSSGAEHADLLEQHRW